MNYSIKWISIICIIYFSIQITHSFRLNKGETRILNGTSALIGDFKAIVSIQDILGHFCSGTLVTYRYVVTAASCFPNITDPVIAEITIVGGDLNVNWDIMPSVPERQIFTVSKVFINPEYNSDTLANNIAIIKLHTQINSTLIFTPIQLQDAAAELPENTNCTIAGWGMTTISSQIMSTNILQKTAVTISNINSCNSSNVNSLPSNVICAAIINNVNVACNGDFGTGLICGDKLTGIASNSVCGIDNKPGVYTDVTKFNTWIFTTITDDQSEDTTTTATSTPTTNPTTTTTTTSPTTTPTTIPPTNSTAITTTTDPGDSGVSLTSSFFAVFAAITILQCLN